jgi:hypothetical protein
MPGEYSSRAFLLPGFNKNASAKDEINFIAYLHVIWGQCIILTEFFKKCEAKSPGNTSIIRGKKIIIYAGSHYEY